MIRVPVPYEPNPLTPCFVARSRREVATTDAVNSRLVEHWQTDAPAVQFARRDVSGVLFAMDMNPTASRLYREDLRQSQPFVPPGPDSEQVRKTIALEDQISRALTQIQRLGDEIARNPQDGGLRKRLAEAQDLYALLIKQQKQLQVDTMSDNPYFNKYDVASDSRNIVREMTSVVQEDVVDRGIRESQKLLQRELENRWLPQGYAQEKGIDQLSAYELMRPKFNDMSRTYR